MSVSSAPPSPMPAMPVPSLTPEYIVTVLGWIISQAVAWGILNGGLAQLIVAIGGIVIPAVVSIIGAVHKNAIVKANAQIRAAKITAGVPR